MKNYVFDVETSVTVYGAATLADAKLALQAALDSMPVSMGDADIHFSDRDSPLIDVYDSEELEEN